MATESTYLLGRLRCGFRNQVRPLLVCKVAIWHQLLLLFLIKGHFMITMLFWWLPVSELLACRLAWDVCAAGRGCFGHDIHLHVRIVVIILLYELLI